jgi:hypothetical protein
MLQLRNSKSRMFFDTYLYIRTVNTLWFSVVADIQHKPALWTLEECYNSCHGRFFFHRMPIFTRNEENLEACLWRKVNWIDVGKGIVNFRRIQEFPWQLQWSGTRNGRSVCVVCLCVSRLLCIICFSQSLLCIWRLNVSTFVPDLPSDSLYIRKFLRTWEAV